MCLEKAIELHTSGKTEQLAQLRRCEAASLVFFESQCFQRTTRKIAIARGDAFGQIIGNVKSKFHLSRV